MTFYIWPMITTNLCCYRYTVRLSLILAFIACILPATCTPARAAFPVSVSEQTIIADTVKTKNIAEPSAEKLERRSTIAVICSFLSIGLFIAAAITGISGLLLPWFLLAVVAMVCARSKFSKSKKYTFAEVISFIAFSPVIAVVAAFYAAAFIVFVAPRMLVNKIRGKKGVLYM